MPLKDVLSICLSSMAFIISLLNFISQKIDMRRSKAPNIVIDKIELLLPDIQETRQLIKEGERENNREVGNDIFPKSDTLPNTSAHEYVLDARSFEVKNKVTDAVYSLILDSSKEKASSFPWLRFCRAVFRNIGYDLISFEIEKIIVFYPNNRAVPFTSRQRTLHCYIGSGNSIDVYLSYISSDDKDALIKRKYIDDAMILDTLEELMPFRENILNCKMPIIMDNYDKIEMHYKTVNIHGEKYRQIIEFTINEQIYTMTSHEPKKIDENEWWKRFWQLDNPNP